MTGSGQVINADNLFQSTDDNALVALVRSGDRRAFQQLYQRHMKRVYALCFRMMADKESAEDVTQEVFVQVWQKLDNFRGESKFSTWLHSVATNTVLSHLRKHKTWLQRVFSIEEQSDTFDIEAVTHDLELSDLDKLIKRLPERARLVFVLFAVEGYRHEEISSMLGMAVGSSKAQFHRAKQLLQEWAQ